MTARYSTSSPGWNLVLSVGDLSHSSGYRTRVMEELQHLDTQCGLNPHLLLFDRKPENFSSVAGVDVPYRTQHRSSFYRVYPEIARLSRLAPVRLVHAHNLYSAALALAVRPLYGYRIVLDYHGRIPEEYVYLGKGGERSRRLLERLERWAVQRSDHVLVVSDRLSEYLQTTHNVPPGKLTVIPCCTDSALFRWNAELRAETRQRLGMAEKLVCTHLGSFFEWYDPELLVRLFSQLLHQAPGRAHLLVITAEAEKARNFLEGKLPNDVFTLRTANHSDVPALLNASDVGFLLLRSSPNIRTSSPVKFAEYLSCGLPVAITPDVGDYSELVQQNGVGRVVGQNQTLDQDFVNEILSNREAVAERCCVAAASLTWTSVLPRWRAAISGTLASEGQP
ncbi:MAG TPA: glycosyltransferase family 4 protein [Terriglobia bacterium]|nr:glycosyltransferase family 4 protein [Terriglobia bacterium]